MGNFLRNKKCFDLSYVFMAVSLGLLTTCVGCRDNKEPPRPPQVKKTPLTVREKFPVAHINTEKKFQIIDGFGFSTAWGQKVKPDLMDAFFSRKTGAGFNIIRNRIPFRNSKKYKDCIVKRNDGGKGDFDYEVVNKGKENEYKVFKLNWNHWDLLRTKKLISAIKANPDYDSPIVFSSPWSPPNNNISQWKSDISYPTDNPEIGGTLKPIHYADYADLLANYVLGFEENMGTPLYALSIQNEPNYKAKWACCDWTAEQIHDFLKILKERWKLKKVFKKLPNLTLIAPEHNNFREKLILPSLADPVTSKLIGVAGGHLYEYGWSKPDSMKINFKPMKKSIAAGKRIWMTEWSPGKFGDTNKIHANLAMAKAMHYLFTECNLNAFVYWWAKALLKDGNPNKALWTMAQYSRFVRPGWYRIQADTEPVKNVYISAFTNPEQNEVAIIVVNMGKEEKSLSLALKSKTYQTLKAYRTSEKENMVGIGPIKTDGDSATVIVPGRSIVTFYGKLN